MTGFLSFAEESEYLKESYSLIDYPFDLIGLISLGEEL